MKANTFDNAVANAISNLKGCQFIHMVYMSEPSLSKTQKAIICGLGGHADIVPIEKRTSGQFQVGFSYQNAVNNRGEKEQGAPIEFVAAPLRWGAWVAGQENKLIENKGILYLRFYGVQNGRVETTYFVGGKAATAEQIELIKQYTERGQVQTQASAGLTENQVICRDVKIANIMEISIDGIKLTRKQENVKTA